MTPSRPPSPDHASGRSLDRPPSVQREIVLRGSKFDVVHASWIGRSGVRLERLLLDHPGSVIMLPILPDGRLVMVRQWRPALERELIELPAGTRARGEPPEICAARELVEETGYHAAELAPLTSFLPAPGLTNERMDAFVARGLVAVGARPEDDEWLEPIVVEPARAWAMVEAGEIDDAKTIVTLVAARRAGIV